jgi:putative endonuclease
MTAGACLYIRRCVDRSYYVGTTRTSLDAPLAEHNAGLNGGYTASRRPVTVAFAQELNSIADAIAAERQVKGWSCAKKEAMINGDWGCLSELSRRRN